MDKKRYYKISELKAKALSRLKNKEIYVKGYDCGFKCGDDIISYRPNYSTGIYSFSAQGKSQFLIEQLVHLSRKYGLKHAVWLTENGASEELATDIAMTYMRKSLTDIDNINPQDILDAYDWMEKFFYVIDHESSMLNIRDIYEAVGEIEREQCIKIDTVSIDNVSNLTREADKAKLLIHEYSNYLMGAVNRTSMAKKYHTFILFHVNKTDAIECKTTKKKYQGKPTHYDISGGSQINYLGYQLINVWRPINSTDNQDIINPETGYPFQMNEAVITVSKSKPKFIGRTASFTIYFDTDRQAYYEMNNGVKSYADQWQQSTPKPLTPSKLF